MRLTVLLVLAGACTFQVPGLPVSPKTGSDPTSSTPPATTPTTTPPASTPNPSDPPAAGDLSSLPDLATAQDLASNPDLLPPPIDCKQDCNVTVPDNQSETIICELGQQCDVSCGAGSHCTVECLGDARCTCRGPGCLITDCAPIQKCKGGVLACNIRCE